MGKNQWDRDRMLEITDRAMTLAAEHGNRRVRRMDIMMTLHFVHTQTPLRLSDLLAAKDSDFAHDVFGMLTHINGETGELDTASFCPKFLAKG
jgi:hypothetical protein